MYQSGRGGIIVPYGQSIRVRAHYGIAVHDARTQHTVQYKRLGKLGLETRPSIGSVHALIDPLKSHAPFFDERQ